MSETVTSGVKGTWQALLSSRKFWVGTITVAAVLGAVALRATGKIPADALVATVTSLTTVAMSVIGSIAWEDASASAAVAPVTTPLPLASPPPSDAQEPPADATSGVSLTRP